MASNATRDKRNAENIAMALDEAVHNCAYFIDEYIYIENKGSNAPVIKFSLWPEQKKSLNDMLTLRWLIFLKARQLGCTWLVLSYALWLMLRPSKRIIALSKTEIDANQLVQRVEFMLRYLPEWFIRQSSVPIKGVMTWDSTATKVWIRHPGSEDSMLMSMPAAQNSGASLTADLVIFDEWGLMEWAAQIYRAAFPTINRPGDKPENGQVFGLSTMRLGSFFHKMVLGAMQGLNDYKLVFWSWRTDPSRDDAWYERTKRNYEGNMNSDYPDTLEEALEAAGGKFFSEVTAATHNRKLPIPEYCRRYVPIDYGLDMLAGILIWDDGKHCHAYGEVHKPDLIISAAAAELKRKTSGSKTDAWYAPPDLWNRRQETGNSAEYTFRQNGVPLIKTNNDREQGCWDMKEWLHIVETKSEQTGEMIREPRLTIDKEACPNLWRCLTTIQADEKNPNVYADKPHELTHVVDALRYFCDARKYPVRGAVSARRSRLFSFERDEPKGLEALSPW